MRAAVVTSFDTSPTCQDFPTPTPQTRDEVLVDAMAAGLHPRVRSQADGSHYTSAGQLPSVPGIDGVGRAPDGTLRYFVLPDTTMGSMAERTVVDLRRSIVLPEGSDAVLIAASINPAMSSWLALRRRVSFPPGQRVLVLGATGNAGRMAVQVAKRLGADHVIGTGRRPERLAELTAIGADATVDIGDAPTVVSQRLGQAARDVDVVIDYLWGQPTVDAMKAIVMNRTDPKQSLTWIEVGSVAGQTAAIPSAALRAACLQIVGSGQGSVSTRDIVAELPALVTEISGGAFRIDARSVPLSDVETAWNDTDSDERLVIVP
jgi:NADPH:quinone reductase-like Zn-dependent oxidoreductase